MKLDQLIACARFSATRSFKWQFVAKPSKLHKKPSAKRTFLFLFSLTANYVRSFKYNLGSSNDPDRRSEYFSCENCLIIKWMLFAVRMSKSKITCSRKTTAHASKSMRSRCRDRRAKATKINIAQLRANVITMLQPLLILPTDFRPI